ncbi:hypothetical protein GOBAR_DD10533 [Gossypium barbadense]|nr:hypothetical protein GOBAR_DD10533 [Gossypium barbadense]
MEQKLVAQHVEMQRLAAQHELQILNAQIEAVTSEREQQMRSLTNKIAEMEEELQATEPVKVKRFFAMLIVYTLSNLE